jgi:uncharacterized protein (TIRG00374 family)
VKPKVKTYLQTFIFLAIGIFLIFWFLNKLSPAEKQEIWHYFLQANPLWMIIAMFIGIISHIFRALRWNLLIESVTKKPKIKNTFWAVMSGYLVNYAVPRLGEITRCALLGKKEKIAVDTVLGTMISERLFDVICYVIIFILAFVALTAKVIAFLDNYNKPTFISWQFALILLLAAILIVVAYKLWRKYKPNSKLGQKISDSIHRFIDGGKSIINLKKKGLFIVYSILIWVCYLLMTYFAFLTIDATYHLPIDAAFAVLALGTIGMIVIQGGIGVYPIIVSQVLILYGVDKVGGYALGWISWIIQTVIVLILGLIGFIILSKKNKYEQIPDFNK